MKATISPPQLTETFWIHCDDHLPDDDVTVLIHCAQSDDPVWLGYHEADTWRSLDGMDLGPDFVDHWADLPQPPKV